MTVRQIWINGEEKLDQFEFIVPCHFGLESVMKKEITDLGYPEPSAGPMYSCGRRNGCF